MFKSIAAVIAGYLAMAIVVFATLTASYFFLGTERVFQPGSYEVTPIWLVVMVIFSVISGLAGGMVCKLIAKRNSAVTALATLAFVLGLISAIATPAKSASVRTGDTANFQAMMNAREPAWFVWLLPVIGFGGVWFGGRATLRH